MPNSIRETKHLINSTGSIGARTWSGDYFLDSTIRNEIRRSDDDHACKDHPHTTPSEFPDQKPYRKNIHRKPMSKIRKIDHYRIQPRRCKRVVEEIKNVKVEL